MPATLNEALSTSEENTIIPGTTPELVLTIDDTKMLKETTKFRLDVTQDGQPIIQTTDVTVTGDKVIHVFTQEETYRMTPGDTIDVQLHGLTENDTAWKTLPLSINIGESLTKTMI